MPLDDHDCVVDSEEVERGLSAKADAVPRVGRPPTVAREEGVEAQESMPVRRRLPDGQHLLVDRLGDGFERRARRGNPKNDES